MVNGEVSIVVPSVGAGGWHVGTGERWGFNVVASLYFVSQLVVSVRSLSWT